MEFFSVFSKFTYKWTPQTNLARLARPFRGRKHHFFPIIAVFQDFQTIQRLQNYLRGCPSISFNIATFLYIDSTTMSVWRPLFIKCIILDHKLQRMLNDSKIAQLNSERPLHQTVVTLNPHFGRKYFNPGLFLQLSHILNLACVKQREQGGAGILQTKALLTYVQKTDILIFLLHEIFFSLLLRFASLLNQKFKIGFLHFLLHYPFPS